MVALAPSPRFISLDRQAAFIELASLRYADESRIHRDRAWL
jgi:hypothetical protein